MTELSKHADFDTSDPLALREELRREHEELYHALVAEERRAPSRWSFVELPDGGTVRANRDEMIVGLSGTVRPPGSPALGDAFVVVVPNVSGSVLVQADDGKSVQGSAAGETWAGVAGWFEYRYAGDVGWFRQVF